LGTASSRKTCPYPRTLRKNWVGIGEQVIIHLITSTEVSAGESESPK
jgi:hypothetical protein